MHSFSVIFHQASLYKHLNLTHLEHYPILPCERKVSVEWTIIRFFYQNCQKNFGTSVNLS